LLHAPDVNFPPELFFNQQINSRAVGRATPIGEIGALNIAQRK
jgi:hypothetical protein